MKQLTLLFLVKKDEVLLAMKKRGFGEGRWNGVGGKIEQGETVEEAMVRECQEEIFVTPKMYEKRALITFNEHHDGEVKEMLVHVFVGRQWEGEPKESEEMKPQWFKKAEVPLDDMWPDDRFWLEKILQGKTIIAEFDLDENDNITRKQVEAVKSLETYSK